MTKSEEMVMFEKVSGLTGYRQNEVAVISKSVAKGCNASELAFFLNVCKSVGLNPFNKEIWCYKDYKGNQIIFTGRDGMLANAQKRPEYNGMRSVEYCENDDVLMIDIPNGVVRHEFDPRKERGRILGAYCIVFRKDGEPTIEVAEFKVYDKKSPTWKSHPASMIKKVSETNALKKAFGFSGVQSEYEFDVDNRGVAKPIQTVQIKGELDGLKDEINLLLEEYKGDDLEAIRETCVGRITTDTFDIDFAKNVLRTLKGEDHGN